MDIATLLGFTSGIALVVITVVLSGGIEGIGAFWNLPSVVLVIGGTFATTLINYPLSDILSMFNTVKNSFIVQTGSATRLIEDLVAYSILARKEGILSLEAETEELEDDFLKYSLQLAVDGTPPELIKDILTTEIAFMEDRHTLGQSILNAMAGFAPAFGMIGTLIGLVQMLTTLDDPSAIGKGMATALLTTLYGALLANLVFLPIAGKLKVRTSLELLEKEIIIEGILAIQSGDNPYIVEQKLKAFIAPGMRSSLNLGK